MWLALAAGLKGLYNGTTIRLVFVDSQHNNDILLMTSTHSPSQWSFLDLAPVVFKLIHLQTHVQHWMVSTLSKS